jgi:hypothetical protein
MLLLCAAITAYLSTNLLLLTAIGTEGKKRK